MRVGVIAMPLPWPKPTTSPSTMATVTTRTTPRDAALISSAARAGGRSEEHTSELQSLMRISYPVFCLKQKTTHHQQSNHVCRSWYPQTTPHTHTLLRVPSKPLYTTH